MIIAGVDICTRSGVCQKMADKIFAKRERKKN
jgi:hypothetical protein